MAATLMDGKALAERVARRGGRGGARARPASGSRPCSSATIPPRRSTSGMKHKAPREAGITAHDHHLPAETSEDELLALVAELNADDAVDGILVQLPLPDHIDEEPRAARGRPDQGRRRLPSRRTPGQLYLGRADARAGDARRGDGAARRVRRSRSRARARSSSAAARSSASRWRMLLLARERDRDDLPLAHARPRRGTRARPTCSSPRSGSAGVVTAGDGQAGRGGDRRRHQPHRGRARRRRRPAVAEVAGLLTPVPGGVGPMTIAMLLRNTRAMPRGTAGTACVPRGRDANVRARFESGRRLGARAVVCFCKEERWLKAPSSGFRTRRATASSSVREATTSSSTSPRSRWTATSR